MSGGFNSKSSSYFTVLLDNNVASRDYIQFIDILTFSPGVLRIGVNIAIINDRVLEGNETFSGVLNRRSHSVIFNPSRATVVITEDLAESELMPVI